MEADAERGSSKKRSRRQEEERRPVAAPLDLESARQKALEGHEAEEARQRAREKEQADLEEEMEKRRKRIEAWQVCVYLHACACPCAVVCVWRLRGACAHTLPHRGARPTTQVGSIFFRGEVPPASC